MSLRDSVHRCGASLLLSVAGCYVMDLQPSARFGVTEWEQRYYEYLEEYGLVRIDYRATNTGPVKIDYYEVWFEVRCRDGSTYQEWTNGLNVAVGTYLTDYTYIDTSDKRATSVTVSRHELTSW